MFAASVFEIIFMLGIDTERNGSRRDKQCLVHSIYSMTTQIGNSSIWWKEIQDKILK